MSADVAILLVLAVVAVAVNAAIGLTAPGPGAPVRRGRVDEERSR